MSVQVTTIPTGARLSAGMTCPLCAGSMVPVTTSAAMVREWRAIMRCTICHGEQLLLVRLVDIAPAAEQPAERERPLCGTTGAYKAHRRREEDPCDDCRRANADAVKARRTKAAAA